MIVSLLSILLLLSTSQVPAGRLDLDSVLRNVSNGAVGTYFSWTFSPNGKWIVGGSSPVTVTDNAGKTIHPSGVFIWDAKTGKFLKRLGDHDARVPFQRTVCLPPRRGLIHMPGYDLFPIRGLVGFCLQAFTGPATRAHHQGRTIRIKRVWLLLFDVYLRGLTGTYG